MFFSLFSTSVVVLNRFIKLKDLKWVMLLYCSLLLTSTVFAQGGLPVSGVVTSQSGEPLGGVSVAVKGSENATTSQNDGSFQINVPENGTLTVSHVGYMTQEIKIGRTGSSKMSIQMLTNKNELEQVVVVGYGTRRKSDVTGSIVSISEQSIKDVPASNLASALQGQGAGIDIQRSGANSKPGATPNILIRGARSLGASNDPLIVVDGIPFSGSINDLNQDDVTSVEVLKDASSTAIYGSRGANGVILISTRRGKSAKPVLTYSGYGGTTKVIRQFPVMNSDEFTTLRKWARINGNPGLYSGLDDPKFLTDGSFAPEELEGIRTGRSTDWQSLVYKTGIMTNHQIGITGGTDATQYAISAGYFNQSGIYADQGFKRYTVKLSVDQQLGKIVKVGLSSLNTYTDREGENANPMAQSLRASPMASPYDSTGKILNDFIPGSANQVWNPLANFIPGAALEQRKRFGTFTTLYVDVNLGKGFKYRFNGGVEIRSDIYGNFYASKTTNRLGAASTSSNRTSFRTNYTLENLLTYDKTFAEKHKVNFTGLFSLQDQVVQSNEFNNTNIAADYLGYYNPTYSANLLGEGNYEKWDIVSFMGRLNYSFTDRYLLTLTMRSDGSSRLDPKNRFHSFPSAAIAWNISKERFFDNVRNISNLKLRASLGRVGNTAIDPYQTLGALSPLVYNFGTTTTTGVFPTSAPNPTLAWEYTTTANLGLDFGILRNRISGSIEVYKQFTSSLLLPQTLPPTSGIPNRILTNVGKTENKGLEIHLSTINIQGASRNSFTWTSDVNFFLNRGTVTQLSEGVTRDVANNWFVGENPRVIYDYKRAGIWQNTTKDSAEAKSLGLTVTGTSSVIGTIRVADLNGDNKIDANDRMIVGTYQPKWEGGTTQRFGYRGFDFTVVAFARIGSTLNSSLEGGNFVNTYQGTYNNLKVNYWTPNSGQNVFPKPNSATTNPAYRSLLGYFDGSFVKIRSMSLGYNIPQAVVKKIGGRSLRAYVTASDPFILFAPYRKTGGIDPEGAGTVGIDTPPVWGLLFGLNLSF